LALYFYFVQDCSLTSIPCHRKRCIIYLESIYFSLYSKSHLEVAQITRQGAVLGFAPELGTDVSEASYLTAFLPFPDRLRRKSGAAATPRRLAMGTNVTCFSAAPTFISYKISTSLRGNHGVYKSAWVRHVQRH
jgi:hypothetical protein